MPVGEPDPIDLVLADDEVPRLILVIDHSSCDVATWHDQVQRRLAQGAAYIASAQFVADFPAVDRTHASVRLLLRDAPAAVVDGLPASVACGDHQISVSGRSYKHRSPSYPHPPAPRQSTAHTPGPNAELARALFSGELEPARRAIAAGVDLNASVLGLGTPLACAIIGGHPELVELLLASGAKFPDESRGGLAYWLQARMLGHREVARTLERLGVRPGWAARMAVGPLRAARWIFKR
ncbi:MAG: ankyrin repeat domain-containing protein [Pirellulales bacterium]|nr:ankyrin repeat domain-containing protein [Pirellulales bacterium]